MSLARQLDTGFTDWLEISSRESLLAYMDERLKSRSASEPRIGLMILEIAQFHRIRASYGYEKVAQLLAQVQKRLKRALPDKDKIFYLGKNEFAIVLNALKVEQQLILAVNKIDQSLALCIDNQGTRLKARVLIGATITKSEAISSLRILQQADKALMQALDTRQDVVVYDQKNTFCSNDIELQQHLEKALDNNQLYSVYQPKTDFLTGELVGVESLSRWESKELGNIPPPRFIEAAERSGLIKKLTLGSIVSAVRQYSKWEEAAVPIAVNLSPILLNDPELLRHVEHSLQIWGMPSDALTLEITETAVMESPEKTLPIMEKLRDLGIRLSIDDFGTGYSSLAYLKDLPVQELKIDKSFIQRIRTELDSRKIVRSIVDLARNFELKVVAEGVEDAETFRLASGMGCHVAQGYLIAKPMKADEFKIWYNKGRWYRFENSLTPN